MTSIPVLRSTPALLQLLQQHQQKLLLQQGFAQCWGRDRCDDEAQQQQQRRALATRRRVPQRWQTNEPRSKHDNKVFEARVKRLLREVDGGAAGKTAAAGGKTAAAAAAASVGSSSGAGDAGAASSSPADAASPSSSSPSESTSGSGAPTAPDSAPSSSSSTSTTTTTPSSSSTSSSSGGWKGWVPSVLRSIMPGIGPQSGQQPKSAPPEPRRSPLLPPAPPLASAAAARSGGGAIDPNAPLAVKAAAAASAQEAGLAERARAQEEASKAAAKQGENADPWQSIALLRNMTLDEYAQQVRNMKPDPPPLPRKAPRGRVDARRIEYRRWTQHEEIVQAMTDHEKALVRLDAAAAAADRELLGALAARSGYGAAEVRDAFLSYADMRARVDALAAWRDSGRPMPEISDYEARRRIIDTVRAEAKQAELAALLARRDRANCPVRPHLRLLGRHVECPNTRLPYSRCCGAKDEKAVAAAVAASPA